MAITQTTRLKLQKQAAGDPAWDVGLNDGFDLADARLLQTGTDVDPSTTVDGHYVGQLFYKTDETPPKVFICTVAGTAPAATWVEISQLIKGGEVAADAVLNNGIAISGKDTGGTPRDLIEIDGADTVNVGKGAQVGVVVGSLSAPILIALDDLANLKAIVGAVQTRILTVDDDGTLDAATLAGVAPADHVRYNAGNYIEVTVAATLPASAGQSSVAHTLASKPRAVDFIAVCTIDDGTEFDVGDEINLADTLNTFDPSTTYWYNATSCFVNTLGTTFEVRNAAGTGIYNLTKANWKIVARCYL